MIIQLKKLRLVYFKGINDLEIVFDWVTNIFGTNKAGKSTIVDAWHWLLFGKNAEDRSDTSFAIKPYLEGKPIPKRNPEVEALIIANGTPIKIKRTLREKWVKKKGSADSVFEGNETLYEWNDVPLKQSEFKARIAELLDENIFKLLTNTSYFNSLKWEDRRSLLERMAGIITNEEIAGGDTELEAAIAELSKYKDLSDFKKYIANAKKRIKDELDLIPARIDEASRAKNALPTEFGSLEVALANHQTQLKVVEDGLESEAAAVKEANVRASEILRQAHSLRSDVLAIESKIRSTVQSSKLDREHAIEYEKKKLRSSKDELPRVNAEISSVSKRKSDLIATQNSLREQWGKINEETFTFTELVFDEKDFCCPTCKRAFEASDVEQRKQQLRDNHEAAKKSASELFNERKAKKLADISKEGKEITSIVAGIDEQLADLNTKKQSLEHLISTISVEVEKLEKQHTELSNDESTRILTEIANSQEIAALNKKAAQLEAEAVVPPSKTTAELKERKAVIQSEIVAIQKQLAAKEQIASLDKRIAELKESHRHKSQELADLESKEFAVARYNREKMDIVEKRVNELFSFVKFKMFDTTNDGSEFPACITLCDGVPYDDANHAAQINAGIDIANAFGKFYEVSVPMFVDNAEAVVDLLSSASQMIRLVVSAADKRLRIETQELEAVA
jgi:DNA repair protein SbcC/Rad50